MSDLSSELTENIEYAGFWVRLWASIIDTVLFMLIISPALIALYGWEYYTADDNPYFYIAGPADLLISWVLPFIATIWWWLKYKATPGKMLFSLSVVDEKTGNALTPKQGIVRYAAYYVSLLPLAIGFIWAAYDSKKQGWHDKIAGTVVVRSKQRGTEPVRFPQG